MASPGPGQLLEKGEVSVPGRRGAKELCEEEWVAADALGRHDQVGGQVHHNAFLSQLRAFQELCKHWLVRTGGSHGNMGRE